MKTRKLFSFLFECENKVSFALVLFYLLGLAFGSVFFTSNFVQAQSFSLDNNFLSVLLKNFVILFIIYILGYTTFAIPIICFTFLYSGICCGISCCTYVVNFGFKGAVFFTLLFYIYYLINLVSMIILSFSSLRLSLVIINVFRNKNKYISPNVYSRSHFIKFLFYIFLSIFSTGYYTYFANNILKVLL